MKQTELRVYRTMERLRTDFERMCNLSIGVPNIKIKHYQEIIIHNYGRIIFKLDDIRGIAGYRPNKVFIDEIDEFVSDKVEEYLKIHTIEF